MRAYLIDPIAMTVTEVEHSGDYKEIYAHIEADCFDTVRLNAEGDAAFVDDEGLLKPQPAANFWRWHNYPQWLAGRGLVLGLGDEGESVAPRITLEQLRAGIAWSPRRDGMVGG